MKNILLSIFVLALSADALYANSKGSVPAAQTQVYPNKTVIIKHPAATDANRFFAEVTVLRIDIYKAGSKEDLEKILLALRKDKAVESCTLDQLNGDFQAINISLKQGQSKAWFAAWLKSAGLGHIKINNDPVKTLDQF